MVDVPAIVMLGTSVPGFPYENPRRKTGCFAPAGPTYVGAESTGGGMGMMSLLVGKRHGFFGGKEDDGKFLHPANLRNVQKCMYVCIYIHIFFETVK